MKHWTEEKLIAEGYKIENAQIKDVSLSIDPDYNCLVLRLKLRGDGWEVVYAVYDLGEAHINGGVQAYRFSGSEKGSEAIMRILAVVGTMRLESMLGKYVRVAKKSTCTVTTIGNIIQDNWFDWSTFFTKEVDKK